MKNFNYDEFMTKLEEKAQEMKEKVPQKCDKKLKIGQQVCQQVEDEEQFDRCESFVMANNVKCKAYGECRVTHKVGKKECGILGKLAMMNIFDSEKVPENAPNATSADVGACHKDLIDSVSACQQKAQPAVEAANDGFDPPTEEEL